MCSSPKSSTKYRRQTRKKQFSQMEYADYARMVRRASACYEAAQQRKAEKQQQAAGQQLEAINKPIDDYKQAVQNDNKTQSGILSDIKAFLLKPVF